ncbi:MAG: hypothetical protein NT151_03645 [Acidobacteria bacterium]|nr:hypothetical protein [Acidobacteriota bacterium]
MPSEFTVRSDSVDVEQIMGRIRGRIREKRGVDYTEDEIRELANVTIEKFLDPTRVRSELLELYLKGRDASEPGSVPQNFTFTRYQIYKSSRGLAGKIIGGLRLMLRPILKLFINPNEIIHALQSQSLINAHNEHIERLNYALIHNLVLELTRLGIEVRNLKMRVESLSSRLDFNERRARAMENAVQYRPGAGPAAAAEPAKESASQPPLQARRDGDHGDGPAKGEAQRRRRRRRRGRGPGPGPGPGGTGQMSSENGGQDGVESEPAAAAGATLPAPSAPAVPDRDTTDQ